MNGSMTIAVTLTTTTLAGLAGAMVR